MESYPPYNMGLWGYVGYGIEIMIDHLLNVEQIF